MPAVKNIHRIAAIDFTRGLVMVVMALDHVRDLLHVDSIMQSPTNLATTTPILFFTRWITYLCAPVFVFLAGLSASISQKSKGDVSASRMFLLRRGLWLILVEFTIVNFGMFFDPGFHTYIFEVIATIGVGFILLSLVVHLPARTTGILGIAIIALNNLLPATFIGSLLFRVTAMPVFAQHVFIMAYPPVPWFGIMLTGFATAKLFELEEQKRKQVLLWLGSAAIMLFIVLRFINRYGDPVQWSVQKSPVFNFLSFINITKYPPSLLFCLLMLGILFFLLAFAEQLKGRLVRAITVYGKVPLFYFVLHFYVLHLLLLVVLYLQGFHFSQMDFASGSFGRPKGLESGLSLGMIYVVWIAVVVTLYKPCLWFSRYKAEHRYWWLRYI